MTEDKIQEAIERLKAINAECKSIYDVVDAYMGKEIACAMDAITFRDALIELLETARDSIPLPKDKNGETIHMDDMMESCGYRYPIRRLFYFSDKGCWRVGGSSIDPMSLTGLYAPEVLRHYHEPTIDDVLREFADKVYATHYVGMHMSIDEIIEAYAKRLELKEQP